jgi:hypothetical protein
MIGRLTRPPLQGALVRRSALIATTGVVLVGLVYIGRWLTFWYDEWSIILDRSTPNVETLLAPHVDHLSIVPVAIYQGLLHTFGMASYWPYLAVVWTCHFVACALLYRVVRARAGTFVAAVACISLLTLGAAFEDVLHAFQMSFLISVAFGLLAVDRLSVMPATRGRVSTAVIALAIAVGSSSVGVLFTGLIIVWGVLERRRELLAASLPVVAAYLLWYVTWGRTGQGPLQDATTGVFPIAASFGFGIGASVVALTGMAPPTYAPLGLAIGAALVTVGAIRGYRPGPLGFAALAALAAEYGLQAWFRSGFGIEYAARSGYLYSGAVFLWLAVADALRGLATRGPSVPVRVVVVIALGLAILGNATQFLGAGRAMRILRVDELAQLRLIESLRDDPDLDTAVPPDIELLPQVTADRYLPAIDRFGAPRLWIELGDNSVVTEEASPERVNAAALRLLDSAFRLGGAASPAPPPAGLAVGPGGSIRPGSTGCIDVVGASETSVTWDVAPGTGIRVGSERGGDLALLLGLRPQGLQAVGVDAGAALAAGDPVIPPTLPAGLAWHAELRVGEGTTPVCFVEG